MKRKGFKSPRDVWLANIHAFLSLEMDPDLKWIPKIQSTAYQLDAIRFILHAQGSFTAFCTPASPSQEFVLTENSYGVFEGPTSPLIDPESGAILGCLDLEYHTFAPISPRLIIVFRNFLLGDVVDDGSRPMRALLFDLLRQLGTKPDQARSLLHDLPVEKCHNSYSTVKDGKAIPVRGYKGLRSSDVFFFKCFPLAAGHVDLINEIFLEQAWATKRLAFGSRAPTQQTIRTYLRDGREGFKIITDASDDPRARYLRILEKALAKLGGPAVRSVSKIIALPEIHMSVWVALKVREELRQKRADLYEIYKMLKPGASKKTFDYDTDQASRMLFLRIKTDVIMNNCGMQISDKNVVKSHRQDIFTSLPIQRVWLYLKVSRNLSRFDLDDFMIQKEPLVLDGPEDIVAKTIHHQQRTQRHTELMFYVGLQDQGW